MKRRTSLVLILLIVIFSGFVFVNDEAKYEDVPQQSFGSGEVLHYKMNFGIFSIGKGRMEINDQLHRMNYRDCYKVDVYGETSGMVDWVAKVDDHWGAYIDSAALVPHLFYRNIREGKYRKYEVTRFDHNTNYIEVKTINNKTGKFKKPVYYEAEGLVRDMLGGYLYMRAFDFDTIPKNSTFHIKGFFEDEFYDLEVRYAGKEKVKTKVGKVKCHKLIPIMPDNKLFKGEDSVVAYLSDDENKIPVKVEARMFIGNAGVELTDYSGLKNPLNVK